MERQSGKHRTVTLAGELTAALKAEISLVKSYYVLDTKNDDYSGVYLPFALARKYPNAAKTFNWHYLFPSS
jgi:hypothetical protein